MQVDKNFLSNEDGIQKKISKKNVDSLMEQLNEVQKEKVKNILSDEKQLSELLNSSAAKKIMEQLKGKE